MINTTPKYFFLLELHLTLLQRYAPQLKWPIFLVTEEPTHPTITNLRDKFPNIHTTTLTQDKEAFLESRAEGTRALPSHIKYVFPIQEDFLLEGRPVENIIQQALSILDEFSPVSSLRLMPCPGPRGFRTFDETDWKFLDFNVDSYVFTYQATLWRRSVYQKYMDDLIEEVEKNYPGPKTPKQKVNLQIRMNLGEVAFGQRILERQPGVHLAWPREGPQPNAVYLCAWPYRPTAIVQGRIEPWALELGNRERVVLPSA
jgi:hypothetical protein